MCRTKGAFAPQSETVIRINTDYSPAHDRKRVTTINPFFEGEIICKRVADKLTFRKPTIDYRGKTVKATKVGNLYAFHLVADVPNGDYLLDSEESSEDQIVIYLN